MAKAPARVKFRTVEREEVAPEQVDQGMRAWATFLGQALQRRVAAESGDGLTVGRTPRTGV